MKKFLVLIACLLMAVFATGSVVADDTTIDAETDTTHVIYNVDSTYTLIIPATFHFGANDKYSFPIDLMVSGSRLTSVQTLNITIASSQYDKYRDDGEGEKGLWRLKDNNDESLYYHIHDGNDNKIKNESTCFKVTGLEIADNATKKVERITEYLHVSLNETAPIAGVFEDYLLFTIKIE